MDLVEDDELTLVAPQEERRVSELVAILSGLEIEVESCSLSGEPSSQCRLADLPWTDQGDRGLSCECAAHLDLSVSRYHPCNLSTQRTNCKDLCCRGLEPRRRRVGDHPRGNPREHVVHHDPPALR